MRTSAVLCVLLALGCESAADLAVDLRTDLVCGAEFRTAQVSIDGGAPLLVQLDPRDDFRAGVRLIDFPALAPGTHHVEIALRLGPRIVAERSLLVELASSRVVTAVFTRSCVEVTCPGAMGDPGRQTCLGGTCVGGACTPETPEHCAPQCASDGDCTAAQACSRAACRDGVCLVEDSGSCGPDLFCHPVTGCQPIGASECPALMQAGDGYCIDVFQQGDMTWTDASAYCAERGGDLCTTAQWQAACHDPAQILDAELEGWEWTNDVADGIAGKSGEGSCDGRSTHEIFIDPFGVRCCVPR